MIELPYLASPLLNLQERAAGQRLPNLTLQDPDGTPVRLYDLLSTGRVLLAVGTQPDVGGELSLTPVIAIGPGGYHDRSGALHGLLGQQDGWILVRPDQHIAWARPGSVGLADALRHALGVDGCSQGTT
jgi:hypothetical protein